MGKTIWKYVLQVTDYQTVSVPRDRKVLTAQVQNGQVCLWVLVDPREEQTPLKVWIHGTGHPVGDAATKGRFVASVQLAGGALVFHVFTGSEG
jgi:hypothetical protein